MGELADALRILAGLEPRERKMALLESENITALVPELIYKQLIQGAEEVLCMREALRKTTIRMDRPEMRVTVYRRGANRILPEAGEVGTLPNASVGDFKVVELIAQKYGEVVPISADLISDAMFDLVEILLREEGRIAENTFNWVTVEELIGNASHSENWNATQGISAIRDAITDVQGENFQPDTLILTPQAAADLFKDSHFHFEVSGERYPLRTGKLPTPILGLDVYILSLNTSNWGYSTNKKVGVVFDSSRAVMVGIKENPRPESIENPLEDLVNLKVKMRFAAKTIFGEATSVLNYA